MCVAISGQPAVEKLNERESAESDLPNGMFNYHNSHSVLALIIIIITYLLYYPGMMAGQ